MLNITMIPENASEVEKLCHLGSSFGEKGAIWTAVAQSSVHYAIKIYSLDQISKEFERIEEEINLVRQLSHANVIKYLSTFSSGQELWIVMPLYGYTSISRVVATHFTDGLPELALSCIFRDVLLALQYLHGRGVIHRAIRGNHILVDCEGKCILSGFRHSTNAISKGQWHRRVHSYPPEIENNLNWASPEMLRQDIEGYSEKTDIYSVGITMCELANGEVPYAQLDPQLMLVEKFFSREPFLRDVNTQNFKNGKESGMAENYADGLSSTSKQNEREFSMSCHNFVSLCLSFNSLLRPSAESLISHSFIKKNRKVHRTLPQLLHPVTPLSSSTHFVKSDSELLQKMNDVSLTEEDVEWIL